MKKITFYFLILCSLGFITYSCDDDDDGPNTNIQDEALTAIITDYTNKTVIATYESMADNAILLMDAVNNLSDEITNEEVKTAAEAWKDTRKYWELSEAFLFGPAAFNNLDPLLDSWPLDKDQLDQVLADVESDEIDMSADYVRNNLGASLRGFHAVEYLLFRDGEPRSGADISESEFVYLEAVAQVLAEDCITLEAWWTGSSNITSQKQEILENAEIEVGDAFGTELINAGLAGSRYASQTAALEEMVQGAMDIADEVGNAKIADPVQSGDVLDVESWYSWNSLTDFKNNIISIEDAYLGGLVESDRDASLSDFVAKKDASLDAEIKANIEEAITKIDEIGEPFRNNLDNEDGTSAAMDACNALFDSLKKIKNLL